MAAQDHGLLVAVFACLPVFELLYTGSFRRRGDCDRTKRQDNPVQYWKFVVLAALLAGVGLWWALRLQAKP